MGMHKFVDAKGDGHIHSWMTLEKQKLMHSIKRNGKK